MCAGMWAAHRKYQHDDFGKWGGTRKGECLYLYDACVCPQRASVWRYQPLGVPNWTKQSRVFISWTNASQCATIGWSAFKFMALRSRLLPLSMDPPFYDNSNTIHYNYNNDCSQSAHTVIHKGRDNWTLLVCSTCCVSSCFVNKKLFF